MITNFSIVSFALAAILCLAVASCTSPSNGASDSVLSIIEDGARRYENTGGIDGYEAPDLAAKAGLDAIDELVSIISSHRSAVARMLALETVIILAKSDLSDEQLQALHDPVIHSLQSDDVDIVSSSFRAAAVLNPPGIDEIFVKVILDESRSDGTRTIAAHNYQEVGSVSGAMKVLEELPDNTKRQLLNNVVESSGKIVLKANAQDVPVWSKWALPQHADAEYINELRKAVNAKASKA